MNKTTRLIAATLLLASNFAFAQTAAPAAHAAAAAPVAAAANLADLLASSPTYKNIKEKGVIVMSTRETSGPFSYNNGSDQFIGYTAEICENVVRSMRVELGLDALRVIYLPVTGPERIEFLEKGYIDIDCTSTTITKSRAEKVNFSYATFYSQTMFTGDKTKKLETIEDLRGVTVAVSDGTIQSKFLGELNEKGYKIKVLSYKNPQEAYLATIDGKADFVTSDDLLLLVMKDSIADSANRLKLFGLTVLPNTYGIGLPKSDPAFTQIFNRHLKALFDSKKTEQLYAKWFLAPIPPKGKAMDWPIGKTKDLFETPTSEALLP